MSTQVRKTVRIHAPFDRVLERVAGFGTLSAWHPAFTGCEVEGDGPGAIRTVTLAGDVVRETLLAEHESGCGYSYAQIEGPLAGREHHGYLFVQSIDDGAAAEVEWAVEATVDAMPAEAVEAALDGIVEMGLVAAKVGLENDVDLSG